MTSTELLELRDRLSGVQVTDAIAPLGIAARAALRGIPLLDLLWAQPARKAKVRRALGGRGLMSNGDIVLGTFRSTATAWVTARWPGFGKSDIFQDIKGGARLAGGTPSGLATAAGGHAMTVAENTFSNVLLDERRNDLSAHLSAQTVTMVAMGYLAAYDKEEMKQIETSKDENRLANRTLAPAQRTIWNAAWEDVRLLEAGTDSQSMMTRSLWAGVAPEQARDSWRNLSARLMHSADENWTCWIDWYEAILSGPAALSESVETARVSLPNELWDSDVKAANAHIASL